MSIWRRLEVSLVAILAGSALALVIGFALRLPPHGVALLSGALAYGCIMAVAPDL